jgi:hypothetical protein
MVDPQNKDKFTIDDENLARVYRSGHEINESIMVKGGVFVVD